MPRLYAFCLIALCAALMTGCGSGGGSPSTSKSAAKPSKTTTAPADSREVRSSAQLQALASAGARAVRACAAKQPGGRTFNTRTGKRCDANGLRTFAPALLADIDSGQLKVQLDPRGHGYIVEASNHGFKSSFYVNHPENLPEQHGCQPAGTEGCSKTATWTTARSTATG